MLSATVLLLLLLLLLCYGGNGDDVQLSQATAAQLITVMAFSSGCLVRPTRPLLAAR